MPDYAANNKRIAKNTIALYFRTFITMIVGLYTGRVMLQALGVEDYGIQSVVGGIVGMTSIIRGSMSVSISRYITCAIGKGDIDHAKKIFATAIDAQIILSIVLFLLLEVIGVWFLNTKANIPDGRMYAANWVLQLSIITLIITLISSPFSAVIVAHEKMGIYAYISVVNAVLKLAICFLIQVYDGDRLICLYILHVIVALGIRFFYGWYCRRSFAEARYSFHKIDKFLLKELTTFSGWNLIENTTWIFSTQGLNMLVNVFFGVVYNASRSVAMTVNGAAQAFVGNFATAFMPQITKSYAAGDKQYAIQLANRGTKFVWLLMCLFIVPIFLESKTLLNIWLETPPPQANLFLRLTLFESLAVESGHTLMRLIQADGRVKRYTLSVSLLTCLVFPFSWIAFSLGADAWVAYVIFIAVFFLRNIIIIENIKRLMPFSVSLYLKSCLVPCVTVLLSSFVIPALVQSCFEEGIFRFILVVFVSILSVIICSYFWGLTKTEKAYVWNIIRKHVKK